MLLSQAMTSSRALGIPKARLTRSGLMVAFIALTADQAVKTFAQDDVDLIQNDGMNSNDESLETARINFAEESKNETAELPWTGNSKILSQDNQFSNFLKQDLQRQRLLQETEVEESADDTLDGETVEELDDVRSQTIYPEPYFTNEQIK